MDDFLKEALDIVKAQATVRTMPKNPSTTEGRLASISTTGLATARTRGLAISARYTAVITPRGIASSEDSAVTAPLAEISGRMP